MRLALSPDDMPVEPNPSYEETKADGQGALRRPNAGHEFVGEIKSCLMPDEKDTLMAYPERSEERALAKTGTRLLLSAPYATEGGWQTENRGQSTERHVRRIRRELRK